MVARKTHDICKGDRFGILTFTGEYKTINSRWCAEFLCDCGKVVYYHLSKVVTGNRKSCGCKCPVTGYREKKSRYEEDYPFYIIFNKVEFNAVNRGIAIEINYLDIKEVWIKQNGFCKYSGLKLDLPNTWIEMKISTSASVDRINSDLSYTKDNICIVHKDVNRMKLDLEEETFINYCKLISEYTRR